MYVIAQNCCMGRTTIIRIWLKIDTFSKSWNPRRYRRNDSFIMICNGSARGRVSYSRSGDLENMFLTFSTAYIHVGVAANPGHPSLEHLDFEPGSNIENFEQQKLEREIMFVLRL